MVRISRTRGMRSRVTGSAVSSAAARRRQGRILRSAGGDLAVEGLASGNDEFIHELIPAVAVPSARPE